MSNITEQERLATVNQMIATRQEQFSAAKSLREIEDGLLEVLFEARRTDYNNAPVIETIKSKADLKTAAAKAAYIGEFGREAYLNLPGN